MKKTNKKNQIMITLATPNYKSYPWMNSSALRDTDPDYKQSLEELIMRGFVQDRRTVDYKIEYRLTLQGKLLLADGGYNWLQKIKELI